MKKWFVLIVVLLVIGGGIYLVNGFVYSSGVRTGKLVKLSKKGVIFKTYEGTLDLGSGDKLTWDFSVRDGKVGQELITKIGKPVELHYHEKLIRWFYKTKYDVYKWKIDGQPYNLARGQVEGERKLEGNNKGNLCLFIKEISKNRPLMLRVRDYLKERESIFEKDFQDCIQ